MRIPILISLLCTFSACGSAKVVGSDNTIRHPLVRIGVAPAGGDIAQSIVEAMRERDELEIEILDLAASGDLLERLNVMGAQAELPENLTRLKQAGVDAWMRTDSGTHAIADTPQFVIVKVTSTHDPEQFIDFKWHNAWGGMRGSLADATMRKSRSEAIEAVVDELLARLAKSPPVRP